MARRSTRRPDVTTLAEANRFNQNALASNRQGRLASSQILRLAFRLAAMLLATLIVIALGIVCIVLAAVVVPKDAFAANWLSLVIAALLFLFGLFWILYGINHTVQNGFPLLRDVIGGQVMMEEGIVSREYDDHAYPSLWHRLLTWVFYFFADKNQKHIEWFSGTHYYVLNGQQFIVSQKGYAALTEESSCRLYYASRSGRLVNIEPVPGDTNLKEELNA
ncbi:MAG: hypothetical protein GY832_25685 [Chloroflexi bacterium]|nr:hypothetical protein [Chloroflexota bacterium]